MTVSKVAQLESQCCTILLFVSIVGIMALAFMRERINPSLACSPTTASEASVTDRTHLSTACMWQGNRGKSIAGVSLLLNVVDHRRLLF